MSTTKGGDYEAGAAAMPPVYTATDPSKTTDYYNSHGQDDVNAPLLASSSSPVPRGPQHTAVQVPPGYSSSDGVGGGVFSSRAIRMGFIRKVYAILTLQLAVTAGIVCLFMYVDSVKEFVQDPDHAWVYWTSYGLTLACVIALVCVGELRRKAPYNFLFLGVFTLCEGYLLGAIATVYDTDIVLMAMGLTVAVSVATTLFACQTRYDFTTLGSTLFAALFVLLFFGLSMIWFYDRVTHMLYAAAGALIFTLYIAYDTQLIIGGKKYAISPEEYIFAALSLYLDVVNLFLFILQLVGGGGRR